MKTTARKLSPSRLSFAIIHHTFKIMDSSPIRIAVIGCGVIGPLHAVCYQHSPHARLDMVCDLIEQRAKNTAEKYGIPRWTTNAAEVFANPDIDAVSICTDHASHAELACAALAAGKHVLCEKCLGRNQADVDRMVAAAAAHPDLVAEGVFQHRFDPLPRVFHAIVREGLLGNLISVSGLHNCYRSKQYYENDNWRGTFAGEGGGVLINQSIHFLDLLLWIGGSPVGVHGYAANLAHRGIIETEDTAALSMRLESGALASLLCTNASHLNWFYRLSFTGTEGFLELRDNTLTQCEFKDPERQNAVRKRIEEAITTEDIAKGKDYYGTGHQAQIDDFVDAVFNKTAPFIPFASAAKTASTVFALYADSKR